MGCEASKPPPVRTSVRNYPGSQGPPKEEGADPATFKGPRSDITYSTQSPTTNKDGEEHPEHPATPKPVVITEEELFNKTSEDCDIILDDGESVSGAEPDPEVTTKEVNKQQSAFGREEQRLHARQSEHVVLSTSRPEVASGELWTDPDYPKSVAMQGIKAKVQWKRPKDFLQNPCLYNDGTCRYDIEQGSLGTCWFLSVLQSLADQPEYLKHIIPEGSYRIGTPEYDGIFHCRFWRFGDWVDIYVDDYIPIVHSEPWGAKSKTDPNELWVTLIEKALTKFCGSYQESHGGWAHHAFASLTAGTCELISLKEIKPKDFYRRAKNSLACGSILATCVYMEKRVEGIGGKHGYSITGICKVVYRSKYISLIRIRNPWGERIGEWTGAWSDGSAEWKQLSPKDKAAVPHTSRGDGEFWMSLADFFMHFYNVTVCNYTPDVDVDGHTDDMNKCWVICGEWKGDSAASYNAKMKNPKFEFEIPQQGIPKEGTPIVIEFMQPPKRKTTEDPLLSLRADLFKVESVFGEEGSQRHLLRLLTTQTVYVLTGTVTYRYPTLGPGKYLVVPYYFNQPGVEKEFLLRIFSQVTLLCREVKADSGYFSSPCAITGFEYEGKMQTTGEVDTRHGAWVSGQNAGGPISHSSAYRNPQYRIHIKHPGQLIEQPCSVSLYQDMTKPCVYVGIRIYKKPDNDKAPTPLNTYWLNGDHDKCPANIEGKQSRLIKQSTITSNYMLMPGDYYVLVFCEKPDQEASYLLQIATKYKTNMKEYNVADIPN